MTVGGILFGGLIVCASSLAAWCDPGHGGAKVLDQTLMTEVPFKDVYRKSRPGFVDKEEARLIASEADFQILKAECQLKITVDFSKQFILVLRKQNHAKMVRPHIARVLKEDGQYRVIVHHGELPEGGPNPAPGYETHIVLVNGVPLPAEFIIEKIQE